MSKTDKDSPSKLVLYLGRWWYPHELPQQKSCSWKLPCKRLDDLIAWYLDELPGSTPADIASAVLTGPLPTDRDYYNVNEHKE